MSSKKRRAKKPINKELEADKKFFAEHGIYKYKRHVDMSDTSRVLISVPTDLTDSGIGYKSITWNQFLQFLKREKRRRSHIAKQKKGT